MTEESYNCNHFQNDYFQLMNDKNIFIKIQLTLKNQAFKAAYNRTAMAHNYKQMVWWYVWVWYILPVTLVSV